jgi:hypothetical protein
MGWCSTLIVRFRTACSRGDFWPLVDDGAGRPKVPTTPANASLLSRLNSAGMGFSDPAPVLDLHGCTDESVAGLVP